MLFSPDSVPPASALAPDNQDNQTTRQPDTGTFAPLRASRDHHPPSYICLPTPQTDCDPLARPPSPRRNRAPSSASRPRILYQQHPHPTPNEPPADFFHESITTTSISPRSLPCSRSCRLHVSATWSLDSPPRTPPPPLQKEEGKKKKKRKGPKKKLPTPRQARAKRNNPRAIRTENFHVLTRYSGLGPLLPQLSLSTVAALRCAYFLHRQTFHPTRFFHPQSGGVGAAATPPFKMMLEEKYGLSPLDRSSQQQQRAAGPVQAADCDMAAALVQ